MLPIQRRESARKRARILAPGATFGAASVVAGRGFWVRPYFSAYFSPPYFSSAPPTPILVLPPRYRRALVTVKFSRRKPAFLGESSFFLAAGLATKRLILRDDSVIVDIASRLRATGLFGVVVAGASPNDYPIGEGDNPAGWVKRTNWMENDRVDPYSPERMGQFSVWLRVADEEPEQRFRLLAEMEFVAINAIEGQSLGGFCWPALSRIVRGVDDASVKPPQSQVVLSGQFYYPPTSGYGGRDTTQVPLN